MPTTHPQPTFSRTAPGEYHINYRGERFGTVTRNPHGVWVTTHRDGTPGPGAWTRIDAAWAMLNS